MLGGSSDGYVPYVTQVGYHATIEILRRNHTIAFDVVDTAEAMISGQVPPALLQFSDVSSHNITEHLNLQQHRKHKLRGQKLEANSQ
jgi:hypothetical protein